MTLPSLTNMLPLDTVSELRALGEVALAMVLGGLIGLEREMAAKPAGFRTHMLVAGAAALLMGLGGELIGRYALISGSSGVVRTDPIRILQAIVTGIAFLGAGTIIRREESRVEGLTTAGSIFMAGILGICVAVHRLVLAFGVTILTLVLLRTMSSLERKWRKHRRDRDGNGG